MVDDSGNELDCSFRALAHPVRRSIVGRLSSGPATVAEAARGACASKPAITKHLRVLQDAGIVDRAVHGRTHVLTLRPHPLAEAAGWIDAQRRRLERAPGVVAAGTEDES